MFFKRVSVNKFSELEVGDFFIFHYEKSGNPIFGYVPILEKVSENNYIWHKGAMFSDSRKTYKVPKIKGVSYSNTQVYKCVWIAESGWCIEN